MLESDFTLPWPSTPKHAIRCDWCCVLDKAGNIVFVAEHDLRHKAVSQIQEPRVIVIMLDRV